MTTELNRRGFLAGCAGAAAVAAAPKTGMRFGFTTYQWGADWDIPTIIANSTKAKAFGVEVRTDAKHAHGIELTLSQAQRREVRKQFAGSPVKLVGVACGERFDSPDPEKLKASVERTRAYIVLARDLGAPGLRVFPNDFQKNVPQEKTIEQIGRALGSLGDFAKQHGVQLRLENHGSAGRMATLRKIIDIAAHPSVRVKLNFDARDAEEPGLAANFALVKSYLGDTLHMHELKDSKFPCQEQFNLLARAGWNGWCLVEQSSKVPDKVQALIEMRETWQAMISRAA